MTRISDLHDAGSGAGVTNYYKYQEPPLLCLGRTRLVSDQVNMRNRCTLARRHPIKIKRLCLLRLYIRVDLGTLTIFDHMTINILINTTRGIRHRRIKQMRTMTTPCLIIRVLNGDGMRLILQRIIKRHARPLISTQHDLMISISLMTRCTNLRTRRIIRQALLPIDRVTTRLRLLYLRRITQIMLM